MDQKLVLVLISCATVFLQAGGRSGGSALQYNERNVLPPQMVDMGQYENVIELQCDELKNHINFAGTKLNSIVKVKVECRKDTRNNRNAPLLRYEDLWYQKAAPLGSKKYGCLPIEERSQVAIFVKSKLGQMSEAEVGACASTLVRLRLELTLNRNLIVTVRVPNQSLEGLVSELRKQNFVRHSEIFEDVDTLIPIQLETDIGRKETLCFRSLREIPADSYD
ncbi:MAG TPA: hypothetical protein EYN91_04415 [Candidatus Melainabacteria bacterium]|jgi:hypothetical protein|nr:hypothetical protein [Candidatus Melainabacteria bacterium]HIN66119.1 hypothetical protein [Candidatus Obscuribacterales bacterium]